MESNGMECNAMEPNEKEWNGVKLGVEYSK